MTKTKKPGTPSPQRVPSCVVVTFKHESDVDGEPIGAMGVLRVGESTVSRFDPNAEAPMWVTRTSAVLYALGLGVPLREV